MISKFEYPGDELDERDTRFRLMLTWADYHTNYRRSADDIRAAGAQILSAVIRTSSSFDGQAEAAKQVLEYHAPGINEQLEDLEVAIAGLHGRQISWRGDVGSAPIRYVDRQGWILNGVIGHTIHDLTRGSMMWLHVGDRPDSEIGNLVDMASMHEIRFINTK
jgi:hypothetical protein